MNNSKYWGFKLLSQYHADSFSAEPELECMGHGFLFVCLFLFSNITNYWPSIWEFWYQTNLRVETALLALVTITFWFTLRWDDLHENWKNKRGGQYLSSGMSALLHPCNIQSLLCTSHQALLRKAASNQHNCELQSHNKTQGIQLSL